MSDLTHRALRVQRMLNSPDWPLIEDILNRTAERFVDAAMECTDPALEIRTLHHGQAARLIVRRFKNALATESSAEADTE